MCVSEVRIHLPIFKEYPRQSCNSAGVSFIYLLFRF
nr:MAG TPA: hypothetical protein [Caudoviricetes sp.]